MAICRAPSRSTSSRCQTRSQERPHVPPPVRAHWRGVCHRHPSRTLRKCQRRAPCSRTHRSAAPHAGTRRTPGGRRGALEARSRRKANCQTPNSTGLAPLLPPLTWQKSKTGRHLRSVAKSSRKPAGSAQECHWVAGLASYRLGDFSRRFAAFRSGGQQFERAHGPMPPRLSGPRAAICRQIIRSGF